MGADELAALEKAKAEAARQQATKPAEDTSLLDLVDTTVGVADLATTETVGNVVSGALDVAGNAVEAVADATGSIVEGIGSILDSL